MIDYLFGIKVTKEAAEKMIDIMADDIYKECKKHGPVVLKALFREIVAAQSEMVDEIMRLRGREGRHNAN